MVQAAEVPGIKRIAELRKESCASGSGQVHHASHRVCAVQRAVGAAKHFDLVNAGGEDAAKIHGAANLIQGNAAEKDLVGFALSAANKQRFIDSSLAALQHLHTGR